MKIAIGAGGSGSIGNSWEQMVEFVVEAEKLGVDAVWTAEAWGMDAATTAAFLAARTNKIQIGTGIMIVTARPPAMTAMTALSLATMSGNRFSLGLGSSGPQVVEGLHGWRFGKPVSRMREHIEIVQKAFRGEKLDYDREFYKMPLDESEGKPLRLAQPANRHIPIYLATLSPKALQLTGELADGWLAQSFTPEGAEPFIKHLKAGAQKIDRNFDDLDLQGGGFVDFGDDMDRLIAKRKEKVAFRLGAMGSKEHNFFNDAFRRAGFEESSRHVQSLWLQGKREAAVLAVPDDLVTRSNLLGTREMVKERVRVYQAVGINTLRVDPEGSNLQQRLDTLGQVVEIVAEVSKETSRKKAGTLPE
jgi:F420-dependent oxidoreductase-like protein